LVNDGTNEETFTLNFAKVVTSYSSTEPTGILARPVIATWDLSAFKAD